VAPSSDVRPAVRVTLLAFVARVRALFRSRRRLRATASGRVLIAMTFAVGFAAFNTGNNLLFFGWGLLLSGIVVSGILSESTLRSVRLRLGAVDELFAASTGALHVEIENPRRLPAFAIDVTVELIDPRGTALPTRTGYELRVSPRDHRAAQVGLAPRRRGAHQVRALIARTAFPFGFFEKSKVVPLDPPVELVVGPARVDVSELLRTRLARLGESPARRQGSGDELFSLRPHRTGDDPRRVAWRRSARTGRLVVRENEAEESRDVILDVSVQGAAPADAERAVEVAHALAWRLLDEGHAVGVRAPGTWVACARGPRQRGAITHALALCDVADAPASLSARSAFVIAIVAAGAARPPRADDVIDVSA
jgi:uncharacterized protein (DUF58 family)